MWTKRKSIRLAGWSLAAVRGRYRRARRSGCAPRRPRFEVMRLRSPPDQAVACAYGRKFSSDDTAQLGRLDAVGQRCLRRCPAAFGQAPGIEKKFSPFFVAPPPLVLLAALAACCESTAALQRRAKAACDRWGFLALGNFQSTAGPWLVSAPSWLIPNATAGWPRFCRSPG